MDTIELLDDYVAQPDWDAPPRYLSPPLEPLLPEDVRHYIPKPQLVHAVNLAMTFGLPLLVTGEPGTGKTALAYHIARQFDLPLFRFDTKTTSRATDILYTYDTLGRFEAVNIDRKAEPSRTIDTSPTAFIRFGALGRAILLANHTPEYVDDLFTVSERKQWQAPCRSVVLIDEVDKARRDFANDLLRELDEMSFYVKETRTPYRVENHEYRPIVIITSNSERDLPEPFLRRCAYHNIEFPEASDLEKIVKARLPEYREKTDLTQQQQQQQQQEASSVVPPPEEDKFLKAAIRFFQELRDDKVGLFKKPATAELLQWLRSLVAIGVNEADFVTPAGGNTILQTYPLLVKSPEDYRTVMRWHEQRFR